MNQHNGSDKESPAEESAGFEDFWAVYDRHYDAIAAEVLRELEADPHAGPIAREWLASEKAVQIRRAIAKGVSGQWADYEALVGSFVGPDLSLDVWFRLQSSLEAHLVPRLVSAYRLDAGRLSTAIQAQRRFFHTSMLTVGTSVLRARQAVSEDAWREVGKSYRQLFEKSPLPSWVVSAVNLRFLEVNDAAVLHYGYSREEFLKMSLVDIRPLDTVPTFLADFAHREEVPFTRSTHRKKNGEVIQVELMGYPFEHESGPARLVIVNDVTERERSLSLLRKSEARFARLSQAGIVGIAVSDLNGAVLDANDAFLSMLGFRREDLAAGGIRWPELTPPEWKEVDDRARAGLLANGVAPLFEKEYFRKDRSRVPVLMGAATLEGSEYLVFVLDLTERKRLEQVRRDAAELQRENRRILEASRMKSEFLANMSHELRTPLNAIIGFSELLQDGMVPPEQAREFQGDVLRSARHLLGLINDVLDLAKVEAGRMEFRPEPVSCTDLAGEVLGVLRPLASEKKMAVEVTVDPALASGVVVDPIRLKQVLYNYLSNALKFTPEGGHVALRMVPEGEEALRIEVEDDGPGIAPEDLDRLFVEFQQLEGGASRRFAGTGLGLALTRRLVEAQGGWVGVHSEPGHGSTFYAVLPRRIVQKPAPQPPEPARPTESDPQKRNAVLVVDDDANSLRLMESALHQLGYRAHCVSDPLLALQLAQTLPVSAVILDVIMPGIDGFEFLDRLRKSPATQATPVLVWTVKDLGKDELERLHRSAQAVLQKGQGGNVALLDHLRRFMSRKPDSERQSAAR